MKLKYFGPSELRKSDEEHIATPVGAACILCEEGIKEGDIGTINFAGQISHYECGLRSVVGSVAHQLRRCSCHGGVGEDPPGMSAREAAIAAARLHEARMRGVVTYKKNTGPDGPTITCLRCGSVSSNPIDIQNLYCGRCHAPHAEPFPSVAPQ